MVDSFRSASITSFVGREKSGNHLWTHKKVNFPTSYSMFFFKLHIKFKSDVLLGDRTIGEGSINTNAQLLATFSDNEGIIFITKNAHHINFEREDIIRFHRIYRNNWFFLGRYKFTRKIAKFDFRFSSVFMFQGKFFIYEDVQQCKRGSFTFFCREEISLPPKIHLLDRATDRFVELKLDINYQNYDFFWISA
jgi:hypothetical protein